MKNIKSKIDFDKNDLIDFTRDEKETIFSIKTNSKLTFDEAKFIANKIALILEDFNSNVVNDCDY